MSTVAGRASFELSHAKCNGMDTINHACAAWLLPSDVDERVGFSAAETATPLLLLAKLWLREDYEQTWAHLFQK